MKKSIEYRLALSKRAQAAGIKNGAWLSALLGGSATTGHALWNETTKQVTLQTLSKLAEILRIPPGELFVPVGKDEPAAKDAEARYRKDNLAPVEGYPEYVVSIQKLATDRGMSNAHEFWQRLDCGSLETAYRLWDGTTQRLTFENVGKLCGLFSCTPTDLFRMEYEAEEEEEDE